jgi:hypothetical protein
LQVRLPKHLDTRLKHGEYQIIFSFRDMKYPGIVYFDALQLNVHFEFYISIMNINQS